MTFFKTFNLRIFFILVFLAFFLSGCSISNNSNLQKNEVKRDGMGLEVNFDVDLKDIQKGLLYYDFSIKNSGDKKIVLRKGENFHLSLDKTNINDIISQEEIEKFYNNLFYNGDIIELYPDFILDNVRGTIKINKDYVLDPTNSDFNIILGINYPYRTDIFQNVEFNLKNNRINVKDKLSQASPLELYNIDMDLLDISSNKYLMKFYFRNKNSFGFNKISEIKIYDLNLRIGSNDLNNCKFFKETDGKLEEHDISEISNLKLNSNLNDFEVNCEYEFEEGTDILTTEISGEINLEHKLVIFNQIYLPDLNN